MKGIAMIRLANESDIDGIVVLFKACIKALDDKQIYQWDDGYPNRDTFSENIQRKHQFVFEDGDLLVGAVCLNEDQALEYKDVSWSTVDGKDLVVHALAINPNHQGRGYGQRILEECETYAKTNGYDVIRLDAFSENPIARRFYEKNDYKHVGEVIFGYKPIGHQRYFCYDKCITSRVNQ